jgi:ubiquinone/menaquinone biosynthesis C-methylase UbiE
MEKHLKNLIFLIPDLLQRNILDLGSGRGVFMLEVLRRGGKITGLEIYDKYIEETNRILQTENLKADVLMGVAENMPFEDNKFGFININGVIEHVLDPKKMMLEVDRVLKTDGKVYMDVPNRFGMKDQHFHLYFVNWMPRKLSDLAVSFLGLDKDYNINNGLQRLSQMHYFTYGKITKFLKEHGFGVEDVREIKIKSKFKGVLEILMMGIYKILRPWYFDSFHLILTKNKY